MDLFLRAPVLGPRGNHGCAARESHEIWFADGGSVKKNAGYKASDTGMARRRLPDVARWICHGCRWGTQRSVVSNNIGGLFLCQHPGLSADFQQGPKKGHKTYEHVAKMAVEVTTQLYLFSPSFAIICKIIAAPFKKDKKGSHIRHIILSGRKSSQLSVHGFSICVDFCHIFYGFFLGCHMDVEPQYDAKASLASCTFQRRWGHGRHFCKNITQ